MDLLKTPSIQSLLDSDLESVDSFQYLDVEELDDVEYALPNNAKDTPTLAEVLSADDDVIEETPQPIRVSDEPATCSALQADFLQGVSQQLLQAQERSSAGAATTLSVGKEGKLTVGTTHGHLLSFHEQVLRWVCNSNADSGAVSCLAYNNDSTRLLAGYARGLICQYESTRGVVLRRVTLGCDIWGMLRVTWAGTSALALDTGGSVWLIKFSRPLGVRSSRTSCLFSGARGEVVAMRARDARVLALATLSRVIIVAGGRAAGVRMGGPPDTLPVLEWCENDERVLVCGRAKTLQWLAVAITGSSISLQLMQRFELKTTPLWLGWLGGSLAIFDVDEKLRLWGEDYDKPLDLSHIEPVYASVFFKGVWTEGRVSGALRAAGAGALGGCGAVAGAAALLGRRGVARVRLRDQAARAQAFIAAGRHQDALRLLCSMKGPDADALAKRFVTFISERPRIVKDKPVADQVVKLCLKFNLGEELWTTLWERCADEKAFVEAMGDAAARGELFDEPPSPDSTQALIERLADVDASLVERVAAAAPLAALDPHRASVFTRQRGLWRANAAVAAALGGACGAMRELIPHVRDGCAGSGACTCAGGALLLLAADALAGRGAAGRALPPHARPSARHDALHALLADEVGSGRSPLRVLVEHEAAAAVRLLEQSAREPPFAGPLAKQNRLRVARALLAVAPDLPELEDRVEILEFISGQLSSGALPPDREAAAAVQQLAAGAPCERADRAWVAAAAGAPAAAVGATGAAGAPAAGASAATATAGATAATATAGATAAAARGRAALERARAAAAAASPPRPRVLWRLHALLGEPAPALQHFFEIERPSAADVDDVFQYLQGRGDADEDEDLLRPYLARLAGLRPRAAAALVGDRYPDALPAILAAAEPTEAILEFGECALEAGRLRGDAAAAHFKNLCILRAASVTDFLTTHPGVVRPESALAIVRETGAAEAEPACLEATGDPEAALEALLRLLAAAADAGDRDLVSALVEDGGSLCVRGGRALPAAAAGALWRRLLAAAGAAGAAPPARLLDAAACLPVEDLIAATCDSRAVGWAILRCAALQRAAWGCHARVAAREAHAALRTALRAARRGAAVRGRCRRCRQPLAARPAARTLHCGRAAHADCEPERACGACGRAVPATAPLVLAPRGPPAAGAAGAAGPAGDAAFELHLAAPPRPDLEGIV